MKVNFIKLNKNAQVPKYGTEFSAGADVFALCDEDSLTIEPGKTVLIHTGIGMQIPEGYAGMIFARSGIATKRGLAPANKVGVIDCDYRGEIMVPLHNHSDIPQTVENGERIAQLIIMPYIQADFFEVDTLNDSKRAEGGFGSTGTK